MATQETVERRRNNRRAAKQVDRQKREREIANRMIRRFFGNGTPDLIALDYRYWQCRRCGWDIRSETLRSIGRKPDGTPILCEPTETRTWLWWRSLNYKSRAVLVRNSDFHLTSQTKND